MPSWQEFKDMSYKDHFFLATALGGTAIQICFLVWLFTQV